MGKSINPMFSFTIRGEAPFGSAPSLVVLMSLQPAIPRQVTLLQCLPPLHRLDSMFHLPARTVNHHSTRAEEFSTGVDIGALKPFPEAREAVLDALRKVLDG